MNPELTTAAEKLFEEKFGNKLAAQESWVVRFAVDFAESLSSPKKEEGKTAELTSAEFFDRLNTIPNYIAHNIKLKLKDGEMLIGSISVQSKEEHKLEKADEIELGKKVWSIIDGFQDATRHTALNQNMVAGLILDIFRPFLTKVTQLGASKESYTAFIDWLPEDMQFCGKTFNKDGLLFRNLPKMIPPAEVYDVFTLEQKYKEFMEQNQK